MLRVVDDGRGPQSRASEAGSGGVGLENVRRRLEELYSGAGSLSLEAGSAGGAVVTVTIPFRRHPGGAPSAVSERSEVRAAWSET
jgi:two-component system sensor histidine kinase LytS